MITYKVGNLFDNVEGFTAIIHIVNNLGAWGAGFVVPLGNRYPYTKLAYQDLASRFNGDIPQGFVLTTIEKDCRIFNCVAQKGVLSDNNPKPFNPEALSKALSYIRFSIYAGEKILMPRIGCGLAGGIWPEVEKIINEHLGNFDVTVFTLPEEVDKYATES